ncbi:MAG: thioredoxin family protein [Bacteroidales bacterium]|nr:thioredoxin family protein [Bacteroidales bacterium]
MKKISILLLLCFFATKHVEAQGINFVENPVWSEVLKMAAEQDKLIFLNCYTVWCAPCRRLKRDVFPLPEVGDFFNANFINVQFDMERGEGIELRQRYGAYIPGFPTMLLIDRDGNVVHQIAGFRDAPTLIAEMKAGLEGGSLSVLRARYKAGDRDPEFLLRYTTALEAALQTRELRAVVAEYLETLPLDSLLIPKNWAIVGAHIIDPFSPQFEFVLRNTNRLIHRANADGHSLERQLSTALDRTIERLVELQTDENGNILLLNADRDKINRLRVLIDIANLRRAETQRALLLIHEQRLDEKWQNALNSISHFAQINALGRSSDRFVDETVRYIATRTSDKDILNQSLALMKGIQERHTGERPNRIRANTHRTTAMLYRMLGDEENAKKSQAIYDEHMRSIESEWRSVVRSQNENPENE